jgi:hypothetical protein
MQDRGAPEGQDEMLQKEEEQRTFMKRFLYFSFNILIILIFNEFLIFFFKPTFSMSKTVPFCPKQYSFGQQHLCGTSQFPLLHRSLIRSTQSKKLTHVSLSLFFF